MILLGFASLVVGFLCGCTSVGGILLIPAVDAWTDLGLRTVMSTVLLSFFFSGFPGLLIHYKAGRIDMGVAVPLCLGAVVFGYAGAVAKEYISIPVLSAVLAAAIIIAGVFALRPVPSTGRIMPPASRRRNIELAIIGAGVSFLAAMTGAGGPVLSVPLMLVLGYPPILTIAVAAPLQMTITLSGSLGNIAVGTIDYTLAAVITLFMATGVAVGTWSIRYFNPERLRIAVALLCIGSGAYMLIRAFL